MELHNLSFYNVKWITIHFKLSTHYMQVINYYTPDAMSKAYVKYMVSTKILFLQESYKAAGKRKEQNNTC